MMIIIITHKIVYLTIPNTINHGRWLKIIDARNPGGFSTRLQGGGGGTCPRIYFDTERRMNSDKFVYTDQFFFYSCNIFLKILVFFFKFYITVYVISQSGKNQNVNVRVRAACRLCTLYARMDSSQCFIQPSDETGLKSPEFVCFFFYLFFLIE